MKYGKLIAFLSLIFLLSSCYHAKISTDKQPSAQVVEKSWHHGFLFGLVYPSAVDAADECANGIAQVDTKLSFVNMLVGQITFGLYTPMNIQVTCAAGSGMSSADMEEDVDMNVAENSSDEEVANSIKKAANKSSELQRPVYINFE